MTRWLGGISRLYADGRYPRGRVLAASAAAVSGAADTAENILATVNIPGGAMGLNGMLRVETKWTVTGSANAKTCRVRLGGIGGQAYQLTAFGASDIAQHDLTTIANRGAANSQIGRISSAGAGGWGVSTGAHTTASIDTSAATTLVITGQKASAGETLTLEAYLVELIIPG